MKRFVFLCLLFMVFSPILAQQNVTFQENFFNNNRFKIDGVDADAEEVAHVMSSFELSQKNFIEGHKQMKIGSGLNILGMGILVGAFVTYGVSGFTQEGLSTYLILSIAGAGVGTVGGAIRRKGKSRVETSVAEYNYLIDRSNYNEISLQVAPDKFGLVFNF
ncbi:hypothetical protein ACFOSV_05085 [Algoriphagus namhaensis]|uniref:Glycine zipper family protein n=1 Tax=Algoriphagus namhaensis TaxID=915353 RepID=A0ABV8AQD3_9BACT